MSMRRFLSTCVAVGVIGGVAGAGTTAAATVLPPRAHLRHVVCQRALDPAGRAISVTAVMRPVKGTVKMALRFQLLSRAKGASTLSAVNGGDLNSWKPSPAGLGQRSGDVWILTKPIVDLVAPATYHFHVQFRWIGAHNRVLATTARDSQTCFQPELRPDLAVQSISATPTTTPGLSTYVATVRNQGATAAGPFEVLYSPGGGAAVKTRFLAGLAAQTSRQVMFRGPTCSSTVMPTITADPNDQVDDPNRANNSKAVVCPALATPALKRAPVGR
jgi:hypothetical protein